MEPVDPVLGQGHHRRLTPHSLGLSQDPIHTVSIRRPGNPGSALPAPTRKEFPTFVTRSLGIFPRQADQRYSGERSRCKIEIDIAIALDYCPFRIRQVALP